ncbi:hypothetical protein ACFQ49_06915 [Kroppenstedtia eburnea]|uniref:hypothetical protein n=1 Tax=Kroppenstedtia eburnea TaxID=714067 RepID=UPI00362BA605
MGKTEWNEEYFMTRLFLAKIQGISSSYVYKRYKKQGKRGATLWGRVAWATGSNFIKVGKVVKVFKAVKSRMGHTFYERWRSLYGFN